MNRRLTIILTLCAGLAGFGAAYLLNAKPSVQSFVASYRHADSAARTALSAEYLKSYSAGELLSAYEKIDPTCHVVAHEMGREVFRKDKNLESASRECSNTCSDGCFHGALMGMFSADVDIGPLHGGSAEEIVGYASSTATDLCSRPGIQKYIRPWKCLHGLGHMLAFGSGYDLDASIRACKTVQGGSFAQGLCASGVFMEFMESDAHKAEFMRKDLYPCDRYPNEYAVGCFRFKGELMVRVWDNVQDLYKECRALAPIKRYACFMGVAWGQVDKDRKKTDFDTLCAIDNAEDKKACIEGAGAFIAINSNTQKNLCVTLPSGYKESCEQTLGNIRSFKP